MKETSATITYDGIGERVRTVSVNENGDTVTRIILYKKVL